MKAVKFLEAMGKKRASVPTFTVLGGEEEYLRSECRKAVLNVLGEGGDYREIDWNVVGDEERALDELFDELRTASLFGNTLIIVTGAEKLLKEHGKALERFAESAPANPLLIDGAALWGKKKGAKIPAALTAMEASGGVMVDCAPLSDRARGFGAASHDNEQCRWVVARAEALGLSIAPPVAQVLCEREAGGLRALATQLDKLKTAIGDRSEISMADLDKHVQDHGDATLFEVVDAFGGRDCSAALTSLDRVFARGLVGASGAKTFDASDVAIRLVALLATRLRELGRMMEMRRDGVDFQECVAKVLGAHRKFLAGKMRAMLESRNARELGSAVLALADLDLALKTGGGDPRELLELYLIEHTRPRPSRSKVRYKRSGA